MIYESKLFRLVLLSPSIQFAKISTFGEETFIHFHALLLSFPFQMVTAKENPPSARVHIPFLASLIAAVRWKPARKRNTPLTGRGLHSTESGGNWRKETPF